MKRRSAVAWILMAAAACTGGTVTGSPPTPPPGATLQSNTARLGPNTSGRGLPPPGSFVTSIVQRGLVDPVPVKGEPVRRNDDARAPAVGNLIQFPLTVTFPDDWRRRSLIICGWTPSDGFYECKSTQAFRENGLAQLPVWARQPHDVYELWVLSSDTSVGLRRLTVLDTTSAAWPLKLQFAPGFETVNDVLAKQPPSGGNYLVVA